MKYRYENMNKLVAALDATNVVSKDFRSTILGYAQLALTEAYNHGIETEKERQAERKGFE